MLGRVITCNHGQNTMEKTLTTSKSFKPKLNIKQKKKKNKRKKRKKKKSSNSQNIFTENNYGIF